MKKISLILLMFIASSKLIAQTTIYTQDFGSGIPAGWVITDSTGLGKIWTYDFNGPSGSAGNIADKLASTTFANGFMIMDDDLYGQAPGYNATGLISTAINCSGFNKVRVKFQDFFRNFTAANAQGVLYISNDSVNWIDVYHAEAGLGNNAPTPNPHLPDINITTIAANQPSVYLKFVYRGDWGYYWELDDIELYVPLPSAVDEINNNSTIGFFPNPTAGYFNISGLKADAIITVTNQAGQMVMVKTVKSQTNLILDLSSLPAGIYTANVKNEKLNSYQKISIVK